MTMMRPSENTTDLIARQFRTCFHCRAECENAAAATVCEDSHAQGDRGGRPRSRDVIEILASRPSDG